MDISLVQQGVIAQQAFANYLLLGSRGRILLAAALSEDERRDYELPVRGQQNFRLTIQVKRPRNPLAPPGA